MYTREELNEAISGEAQLVKDIKAQVKRLEKISALYFEYSVNNTFGYEQLTSIANTLPALHYFNGLIEQSKARTKHYKKILSQMDKLDALMTVGA